MQVILLDAMQTFLDSILGILMLKGTLKLLE